MSTKIIKIRKSERRGQDWIGPELGVPARTVGRVLRRHQLPYLADCEPITGQVIRASKATAIRYERDHPGAATFFAAHGIDRIERVITDNHWSYRHSTDLATAVARIGVERFNRTLATEWAYRQIFTSNTERATALAPWLKFYNTRRRHTALGGHPPISRL